MATKKATPKRFNPRVNPIDDNAVYAAVDSLGSMHGHHVAATHATSSTKGIPGTVNCRIVDAMGSRRCTLIVWDNAKPEYIKKLLGATCRFLYENE